MRHHCTRRDRIAGAIIFLAVIIVAHLIYWAATGDYRISLWSQG